MDYNYDNNNVNNTPEPDKSEKETFVSGEYHFSGQEHRERASSWSDPVIDKVEDDKESFYSPNFHSTGSYSAAYSEKEEKKRKKREKRSGKGFGFAKVLCLVLACVILSAAASGAVTWTMMDRYGAFDPDGGGKQVVIGSSAVVNSDGSGVSDNIQVTGDTLTGTEIYAIGCKQAVGIQTSVVSTNIFGQQTTSAVTGSGFIISEDGYIMTNYHVIEYSAAYDYDLTVMMNSGEEYEAQIIGYDADNDIAVIKIDATGLSPVSFGDSDVINVGEAVYALGNPLGELTFSLTTGSVSALDRVISTDTNTSINMFQFDAAVNSGNSGGPLYNSKGQVIGVVTAKYASSGVEGLGFAVPINDAVSIAQQLIENGYVTGKAYLGIIPQDIEEYVIQYYGIPEGTYVASVTDGYCAAKAGLKAGDIITAIDGSDTHSAEELKAVLRTHSAGETVELSIYRAGETMTVEVTLDEAPADTTITQEELDQQQIPFPQR